MKCFCFCRLANGSFSRRRRRSRISLFAICVDLLRNMFMHWLKNRIDDFLTFPPSVCYGLIRFNVRESVCVVSKCIKKYRLGNRYGVQRSTYQLNVYVCVYLKERLRGLSPSVWACIQKLMTNICVVCSVVYYCVTPSNTRQSAFYSFILHIYTHTHEEQETDIEWAISTVRNGCDWSTIHFDSESIVFRSTANNTC